MIVNLFLIFGSTFISLVICFTQTFSLLYFSCGIEPFHALILQEFAEPLEIVFVLWRFLLLLLVVSLGMQWVRLSFLRIELHSRLVLVILEKKNIRIVFNFQIAWQLLLVLLYAIIY